MNKTNQDFTENNRNQSVFFKKSLVILSQPAHVAWQILKKRVQV